ncbi:MAG: maleylpyruvate isomerase N-terminal domain-containing protein [Dermatophilaceae bacterium]
MDPRSPGVLSVLASHTTRLLVSARGLDDPARPSLCAGWTRGHVLTHLARNADGLTALVRAAVDGSGETMYAGDAERDADIDAGASRPLDVLVADVESSAAALAAALSRLTADHAERPAERTPGGQVLRTGALPLLRLREVVYHHVDLDAGFGFADVEPPLVATFLAGEYERLGDAAPRARAAELLWRARGIRAEDGR